MPKKTKSSKEEIHFGDFTSVYGDVFTGGKTINQNPFSEQNQMMEEFQRILIEIEKRLPEANLEKNTEDVVVQDIKTVQSQTTTEKPEPVVILGKLKTVAEIVSTASGVATAVQILMPLIHKAIDLAGKLF